MSYNGVLIARSALLVPSGPYHQPDKQHLHIVCTDTDENGKNLLVPVSTWVNEFCDDTCILLCHEHRWLKKPKSYVSYRHTKQIEASKIKKAIESGTISVVDDCNAQTFLRVQNGILSSPQTPRKFKAYFSEMLS